MALNLATLKKERTALRSSMTKCYNKILELSRSYQAGDSTDELRVHMELMETRYQGIISKDALIGEIICNDSVDETNIDDELQKEQDKVDEYTCMFYRSKALVDKILADKIEKSTADYCNSYEGHVSSRKYKLPTLKLREFNGELKDWLPFWSQFSKIDEDPDLDNADKLGYLSMSMTQGSSAFELVNSYPATKDMYPMVVKALKERFGREDLLTEFYIRELLKLILQNTISKDKLSMTVLYDRLQCHLRNLSTLGITTENCAAILMPLVSSCLPEETLQIWERKSMLSSTDLNATSKDSLSNLLMFLKTEVEGAQKLQLAKTSFGMEVSSSVKSKMKKEVKQNDNVPTATDLVNMTSKIFCVFCQSSSHKPQDCKAKMTLDERRKIINDKALCYCCLRSGHIASQCRIRPKCLECGRGHFAIMCHPTKFKKSSAQASSALNIVEDVTLASMSLCNVLMHTLVVNIHGEHNQVKRARLLIDTGSQRSYILANTAIEMKLNPKGKERIQHALFGGSLTEAIDHNIYQLSVSKLDMSYRCNFEVISQKKICGRIPVIPDGPWVDELASNDIRLSDQQVNTVNIEILVGADIAAKLWTSNRVVLKSGLVAMETFLGWTMSGKICGKPNVQNDTVSTLVTNMLVKEASVSDLWSLDLLGIKDPTEKSQKAEIEKETCEHFRSTVKINNENRFEVHLPFIKHHPPLSDNYLPSLKRLESTIKKLNLDGYLNDYQKVLDNWIKKGVIEEVPEEEINKSAHYLPHHHVVKVGSTTPVRPVFDASSKSNGGVSLNQCLDKGPNLIEKIPSCLARFRLKKIGVSGDIEKAFLQISINPKDRDFLRFLWKSKDGQIKVYRHCRVVFGVSPSPFLLESTIQLHLEDVIKKCENGESQWPLSLIKTLKESFYVDNCLTSLENEDQAEKFIHVASSVMKERPFDLRLEGGKSQGKKIRPDTLMF